MAGTTIGRLPRWRRTGVPCQVFGGPGARAHEASRLLHDTDLIVVLTVKEGGIMQARTFESVEPFDAGVEFLRDHVRRLQR